MASVSQKNKAVSLGAARALERLVEQVEKKAIPAVLEKVGEFADEHSRRTANFRDVSGNLRSGYSHLVLSSRSSGEFEWNSKDGGGSEHVNNPDDVILLVYGNGISYAPIIEKVRGFDVSIQTHLHLRRELKRMLGDNLKVKNII